MCCRPWLIAALERDDRERPWAMASIIRHVPGPQSLSLSCWSMSRVPSGFSIHGTVDLFVLLDDISTYKYHRWEELNKASSMVSRH